MFVTESVMECALCRAVISEIDKLLGDPKIDGEIEAVVEKVCKYLPPSKQDQVIFYYPINFPRTNYLKLIN